MPAVELRRLRNQILELSNWIYDPTRFCKEVKGLLDQYANRAYRAGQAVKSQSLLPSYKIAPLIQRELSVEFARLGQEQPDRALLAADSLWEDAYLEPRLLATILLGAVPFTRGDAVLARLRTWAKPDENYQLLDALFHNGTTNLRRSGAARILGLAEEWITNSAEQTQALGIRILIPLVHDDAFQNLPPVYRLLNPLLLKIPAKFQADLQGLIEELARRSPVETAYFLRQSLTISEGQATARLVRRCLPAFEKEQQDSLKALMRTMNFS